MCGYCFEGGGAGGFGGQGGDEGGAEGLVVQKDVRVVEVFVPVGLEATDCGNGAGEVGVACEHHYRCVFEREVRVWWYCGCWERMERARGDALCREGFVEGFCGARDGEAAGVVNDLEEG